MDPGVHALQVLDVIHMKDSTHKMTFYHNLPQVMGDIPKVSLSFPRFFIITDSRGSQRNSSFFLERLMP